MQFLDQLNRGTFIESWLCEGDEEIEDGKREDMMFATCAVCVDARVKCLSTTFTVHFVRV